MSGVIDLRFAATTGKWLYLVITQAVSYQSQSENSKYSFSLIT